LLVAALLVSGCGAAAADRPDVATAGADAPEVSDGLDAPIGLVQTDVGLAGVRVGTSDPVWQVAGAVAAPDGTAIFVAQPDPTGATHRFDIVEVDASSGEPAASGTEVFSRGGDIIVAAVAPDGARVAAVEHLATSTIVYDIDPAARELVRAVVFEGRLEP
jgi:hypothetical protein